MWNDEKFVAFDFETSGALPEYALQPWRVQQGKAWATSLVWARKTESGFDIQGGIDPTVEMMRQFLEETIAANRTIVGWNTVFDIQWLIAYGLYDLVMKARWLDGMLLWRHFFIEPEYDMDRGQKRSYGLKNCVAEVLPKFAGYEQEVDFHDPSPEARAKLHRYNVQDVLFTLKLARHWFNKLEPSQRRAALLEAQCLPLVANANLMGLMVDTLAARELETTMKDTDESLLAALAPHGVDQATVRNPTKLAKLMFDVWGLPVFKENTGKKTGKVSRPTDKETLHELSFMDPRAKTLRSYREALNNRTKFAVAPLDSVTYNGDNRTHPQAIVFGTYSGRLTYASKQGKNKDERQTGFALHQEKRDAMFRNIVIPPPGYTLVEFDASGQEFRWMAIASGDPVMLDLCLPGEDAHAYMGARIVRADYKTLIHEVHEGNKEAKDNRQLGKVANLSLQYRTSPPKLRSVARVVYNLPMDLAQAKKIHRTYQQSYRKVPVYWDKQIALTKKLGYVETFAGRRVQVAGNWEGKLAWAMGSTSINYRIQGTGADQKYLAMACLRPLLVECGAFFAWDLHDGIYMFVPDASVEKFFVRARNLLDNLPYQRAWGFTPPIPLPWDCKAGKSWGTLK